MIYVVGLEYNKMLAFCLYSELLTSTKLLWFICLLNVIQIGILCEKKPSSSLNIFSKTLLKLNNKKWSLFCVQYRMQIFCKPDLKSRPWTVPFFNYTKTNAMVNFSAVICLDEVVCIVRMTSDKCIWLLYFLDSISR